MNSIQNMQINEDGILLRYDGEETVVTVPEGVTVIYGEYWLQEDIVSHILIIIRISSLPMI